MDPKYPTLANQFQIRCTSPDNHWFHPGFIHLGPEWEGAGFWNTLHMHVWVQLASCYFFCLFFSEYAKKKFIKTFLKNQNFFSFVNFHNCFGIIHSYPCIFLDISWDMYEPSTNLQCNSVTLHVCPELHKYNSVLCLSYSFFLA